MFILLPQLLHQLQEQLTGWYFVLEEVVVVLLVIILMVVLVEDLVDVLGVTTIPPKWVLPLLYPLEVVVVVGLTPALPQIMEIMVIAAALIRVEQE